MSGSRARIYIDDETFPDAPVAVIEAAVRLTLDASRRTNAEISVALLPDEEMRRLNHQFLGKDRTTDVLAFTLSAGEEPTVGDIYLGYRQAERQAEEIGVPFREELVRLAIHGTLHVLGYDHPPGPERSESPMFQLQERLVRDLLEDADAR
jgi:probable rRNA maturation factor